MIIATRIARYLPDGSSDFGEGDNQVGEFHTCHAVHCSLSPATYVYILAAYILDRMTGFVVYDLQAKKATSPTQLETGGNLPYEATTTL